MSKSMVTVMVVGMVLVAACGGSGGQDALEIVGTYTDDWGTTHTITETSWTQQSSGTDDSVFEIAAYDNDADFLVAHNAVGNPYNPDKWSRFDWTEDAGALYYCQIAYKAESQEEAAAVTSADRSDLEKGCNGFAWSKLTAQ